MMLSHVTKCKKKSKESEGGESSEDDTNGNKEWAEDAKANEDATKQSASTPTSKPAHDQNERKDTKGGESSEDDTNGNKEQAEDAKANEDATEQSASTPTSKPAHDQNERKDTKGGESSEDDTNGNKEWAEDAKANEDATEQSASTQTSKPAHDQNDQVQDDSHTVTSNVRCSTKQRKKYFLYKRPSARQAKCSQCGKTVLRKNLRKHLREKHKGFPEFQPLPCMAVDYKEGIYIVCSNNEGNVHPLHVQCKISSPVQRIFCDSDICTQLMMAHNRGNLSGFGCVHVRSVPQAKNYQQPKPITETGLNNLIKEKLFKPESLREILDVVRWSETHEVVPALTFWNYVTSDFVYMSVVSVKEHFYCRCSRIVVRFDKKSGYFDCACCRRKRNCLHKKVAMAHLALNSPQLIKIKELSSDDDLTCLHLQKDQSLEKSCAITDQRKLELYLKHRRSKIIMPNVPSVARSDNSFANIVSIMPKELYCMFCKSKPKLSPAKEMLHKANLYDIDHIFKGSYSSCVG